MKFEILTERETLEACHDMSIARFGDGELRIANGAGAVSQAPDQKLAAELRAILESYAGCMVAIPNFPATPNKATWDKYAAPPFARFYQQETYGSAFITRADNAPWIDNPEYWDAVRALWRGKDVALVAGDMKSLTPALLTEARQVTRIEAPRQGAYTVIDKLEETLATWSGLVLLCLGATATALAARLDRRGVHALDLGHIGMFMRHAGAYEIKPEDVASPAYRAQLQEKHASMKWGKSGGSHAPEILPFMKQLDAKSVLDYGCGRGTLKPALPDLKVFEYDPGIKGKDGLPKPADVVACTDVLEHIEPELLDHVLKHIRLLAGKGAYLVIATRPARELLPDGRNAHLIVKPEAWWIEKLKEHGWAKIRTESRKGLCVWLEK